MKKNYLRAAGIRIHRVCLGMLAMVVTTGALTTGLLLGNPTRVSAAPLVCDVSRTFLSFAEGTTTQLVEMGFNSTGGPTFTNIGGTQPVYNALGYNQVDGFLYAIEIDANNVSSLVRVHDDGTIESIALLSDLGVDAADAARFWQSGTIDATGRMFIGYSHNAATHIYSINLSALPATPTATRIDTSQTLAGIGDFVYVSGFLWGIQSDGQIARIDPATGTVTKFAQTAVPATTTAWMGLWEYGDGSIGVMERETGRFVRIRINDPASATPTFTQIATATGDTASNGDATSCISAQPLDLGITASAPATVAPSASIPIQYTVTNNGPENSSGFILQQQLPPEFTNYAVTTPGCSISGTLLQCIIGPLNNGDDFVINLTAQAPPTPGVCGTNGAQIIPNESDSNPDNNYDEVQTCVAAAPVPTSDIEIVADGPDEVTVGDDATWVYTVTNNGPDDASAVEVVQTLPEGFTDYTTTTPGCTIEGNQLRCVVGDMPVGDTFEVTLVARVPATAAGQCFTMSPSTSTTTTETNMTNNNDQVSTCAVAAAQNEAVPSAPDTGVGSSYRTAILGAIGVVAVAFAAIMAARHFRATRR